MHKQHLTSMCTWKMDEQSQTNEFEQNYYFFVEVNHHFRLNLVRFKLHQDCR